MKNLVVLIIVFCLFSCKKEIEKAPENTSNNNLIEFDEFDFSDSREKIVLISIIRDVEKDTVREILKEFTRVTKKNSHNFLPESDNFECEKLIDSISKNYKLSNQLVAKIILDYKYNLKENEN